MKRVLVLGSFDLTHAGHVRFLKQAANLGEDLWVALNTDDFIRRYKRPPILTYAERKEMLSALSVVDAVFPNFGSEDSKPAIVYANKGASDGLVIVHGDDWTGADYLRQLQVTEEWLDQRMIEIAYVPYTASVSTTMILDRIALMDTTLFCRCGTVCVGQSVLDDQAEFNILPRRRCKGL